MPLPRTGIWIAGATGRTGRALTRRLLETTDHEITLLGRDAGRLERASADLPRPVRTAVHPDLAAAAEAVRHGRPLVLVNLAGDYRGSTVPLARATLPGGHYVDLANDLRVLEELRTLDADARAAGSTLVTGAGFGVLATEALVVRLTRGLPTPASVQVDALGSSATQDGETGEAFAASVVDVLTTGGREFRGGELVRTRLAARAERFTLPDGTTVASASAPSAELLAAHLASGAPDVVATSGLVPAQRVVRALLPLAGRALSIPALRRAAVSRLARTRTQAAARPRPHSWGRAVVVWPDGSRREGWLRAGDAMEFTGEVLLAVTRRVADGRTDPGVHTPAGACGPDVAEEAGARLSPAEPAPPRR
ncbi:saccharopine dehydrogenase NADP-binding domain-containing protein [Kineococcus rhizosphaerae]|uniref:Short subunit dehydrogenase-like uncharacterized protein n=1 Tax=Kineococcus rhizosphaerae TaxID=559628 RepID=A0A2T0R3R8_9ACTN|nr:saccharopine dehydrogenase NADP-binding domain-containing protein [Kineococcus rhizosphaerae]PRY14702.1 short subunit dehydrogenase-like uncharacterized protein [Kineococcus rhizosphaerae]